MGVESVVPHINTVEAKVNVPGLVQLYDVNGKGIVVNAAEESYWLAQGFMHERLDPQAMVQAFVATLDALKPAVREYVEGVTSDGFIDHSDEGARAAAYVAMRELEQAWFWLQRAIDATYPNREADPVEMQQVNGQTIRVDPGQVEIYGAQGYEVKA